jgi:hypothetical protein
MIFIIDGFVIHIPDYALNLDDLHHGLYEVGFFYVEK